MYGTLRVDADRAGAIESKHAPDESDPGTTIGSNK
jgi:hypothetical protein